MKKFIIIFCIFLAGCAGGITFSCLDCLRLGMSHTDAAQALNKKPFKTITVGVDSKKYTVDIYIIINGEYTAKYLLAYDPSGDLIYWGYPTEFERSQKKLLNDIGAQAVKKLD